MSLLAGFDMVTEIANPTIRNLIRKNMSLGGVPANPPFELTLPLGTGFSGSVHLVVTDLQLDLNSDESLTLHLAFDRTSAFAQSPLPLTICPLEGTIHVKVPLSLTGSGNTRQVTGMTSSATVTSDYSQASEQVIANALAGSPITPQQFKALALAKITSFVQSTTNATLPMAFTVLPGMNGSISPLQYSSLKLHCITNADRKKQALALCGNLLAATQNKGNPSGKTTTAIAAGRDVAVSIAPEAFHTIFFCPQVATALGVEINQLPTSCGGAGSLSKEGVEITSLKDTFANGHINIVGTVEKSGFCYDASGSFHAQVALAVSGGSLVPTLSLDEPDVSIDIPWYCYLAVGVVLGPLAATILFIVDQIIDSVVDGIAKSALSGALGSGLGAISVGGLSGASFNAVAVTPEGMTLQGSVPVFVPTSSFSPNLDIFGSVTTSSRAALSSGTWHTRIVCQSEVKDYPYTEYAQSQTGTYDLTSSMLAIPLRPSYSIAAVGAGESFPLKGQSGTITIDNVNTTYCLPLDLGGSEVKQTIHIDFEVIGTLVKLRNRPEEGNFSLILTASVKDCAGKAPGGIPASVTNVVQFDGNFAEIGGGYWEQYQECMSWLRNRAREISERYASRVEYVPVWVKVNYPPPELIIEQMRVLIALGLRQADDMLIHTRVAHGASFARAIHAPTSVKLGINNVTVRQLQAKAQIVSVRQQLGRLTSELADLQLNSTRINPKITGLRIRRI